MSDPVTPGGGGGGWGPTATPPGSGPRTCGIGCNINVHDGGGLVVRGVIAGGPAAFSCDIAIGDILLAVDNVNVTHDTPDDVARRISGPEGVPISVTVRMRRTLRGGAPLIENTVHLLRQPTIPFPAALAAQPTGLGLSLERNDNGLLQVRGLQAGGAAALSGKLRIGDVISEIDGMEVRTMGAGVDLASLLVGAPFSRVSLVVESNGNSREVHMVRSPVLMGEFPMRHNSYKNALAHAIIQPAPPGAAASPPRQGSLQAQAARGGGVQMQTPGGRQPQNRVDLSNLDRRFEQAMAGGTQPQQGWRAAEEVVGGPVAAAGESPMLMWDMGGGREDVTSMYSRSSSQSRDSIALIVRQQFGDGVDSIRTVDGREATFTEDWPHAHNTRLSKGRMAHAGFLHAADSEAADKVMCVYCGLELGHWESEDDPWMAHHEASPGCSFWRKSSSAGERLSKLLYSGYGSPHHSMYRTAGTAERMSVGMGVV